MYRCYLGCLGRRNGVLSSRQCLFEVFKKVSEEDEGVKIWINEIIWREFYKYLSNGKLWKIIRFDPSKVHPDNKINGLDPNIITTEIKLLKKIGAKIKTSKDKIHIHGPQKIKSIRNITTKEYEGFPTDLQPQFMVLLCKANGISTITENIFQGRFIHVMELQRLGAKISIKDSTAIIEGNTNFSGSEVMSSDLRASAALVLAGIVSKGQTTISRIYHLDRGYEKIENKLKKIGVRIKRIS